MEVSSGISRAIELAVRAGAFSVAARRYPAVAETYLAAAEVNSARAKRALDEAMGAAGTVPFRASGR